jgi:UDP-GlcNAc:undecaprenyl-phosphate GlcNAc-1-phosphate transferase
LLAAVIALGWCWLALRLGPVLGFVDAPDGILKTHKVAAVPLGGVGVLLGTLAGLGFLGHLDPLLLMGSLVLLAVGLADDRFGISPVIRLSVAAFAGAVMAFGERGLWWGLALIALLVICVNAVNLIDGIDALAGSTAAISLAGMGFLALTRDGPNWAIPLTSSAALLGFLVWNRPPARVFLGDNGAYVTGSLLAYTSFVVARNPGEVLAGVALIGFPLFDLAVTLLRRLRSRSSLFLGDRDHTYDRLQRLPGWSPGRVSATIALLQALWVSLLIVSERAAGPGPALTIAAGLGLSAIVWAATRRV